MPAYLAPTFDEFLIASPDAVIGRLAQAQGNVTDDQVYAWRQEIFILTDALSVLVEGYPRIHDFGILLEYPLFRVGRRLDAVALVGSAICVIEFKVGSEFADSAAKRQVEDYALDLRDFHAPSVGREIFPVVCPTEYIGPMLELSEATECVARTVTVSRSGLGTFLQSLIVAESKQGSISVHDWDCGAYRPIPPIIEAASMLYLTHSVVEIRQALSSHVNLNETVDRIAEIRQWAIENRRKAVCFVTGVPGSGKTLVGLNLVHDPRFGGAGGGEAAFLSGNSPLVAVLREALARDAAKSRGRAIGIERRNVRARIQHLMSYLRQYLDHEPGRAPHDHIVVFDEAQRAWDEAYGKQKFGRTASEPYLFLEILGRHTDWALIVALVGGGQEINTGEHGLVEWGKALLRYNEQVEAHSRWEVIGPSQLQETSSVYGGAPLWEGEPPISVPVKIQDGLHLPVTIRSFRNEVANEWIAAFLDGNQLAARRLAMDVASFPIFVTRSLNAARGWLRRTSRGKRRFGLLATSGARRLRAYGLGVTLNASDLPGIVNWFLAEPEDVRSSFALEVTANEFACQAWSWIASAFAGKAT